MTIKRHYDNSKREAKAEATRQKIIDALIQQLIENNTPDFSVEEAAATAGVTTRTLFRHFSNKEEMLAGVSEGILKLTGKIKEPETPADFLQVFKNTYGLFQQHPDLIKATLLSDLGRGARSALAERRRKANMSALTPLVASLQDEEAKAVQAVLCNLITAETWLNVTTNFNLNSNNAYVVINWLLQLAFAALQAGNYPDFQPSSLTDGVAN